MIDFHNHLIPGVDDGAEDLEQSRQSLTLFREQGIRGLVVTPHLQGSWTERPERLAARLEELDAGWERFSALAREEFPELRVARGAEVMLDTPAPDLSDPRVRLAGTSYVLVEFPYMSVPPNSGSVLFELKIRGWSPVIAHPERYTGVDAGLEVVEEWRRMGGHLQVNSGSLLGRYGGAAQVTAWRLLRRGWVSYLSSDYHARGRCSIAEARALLQEKGAEEQVRLLTETNPERLLQNAAPEEVPPLEERRPSLWNRLKGALGR